MTYTKEKSLSSWFGKDFHEHDHPYEDEHHKENEQQEPPAGLLSVLL